MKEDIIVAGFGGQGILFLGKLLTWAGVIENKIVTCIPSYGAEMRGGTANCHVVISDKEISSPIVENPSILIVLNTQSLDKFEEKVLKGGRIIVNSSLIDKKVKNKNAKVWYVPGNEIAEKIGSSLYTNMVILGAASFYTGIVKPESLISSLPHMLKGKKEKLIPFNKKALETGYEFAKKTQRNI